MPKVAARSLLGLWFLVAAPTSSLHLCSLDSCACSWALLWSHRLDLVGQQRPVEGNRKSWSPTARGRDRNTHRGSERQRNRRAEAERDTDGYRERERATGG